MRTIALLLTLLPLGLLGKDYCKQIKETRDAKTGALTLRSPDMTNITVLKQFRTDTFFALLLHFTDEHEHFKGGGGVITFEDGTSITDESVTVHCVQEQSQIMSGQMSTGIMSGRYLLQGFFRITEENAAHFMLKKIASVQLHTAVKVVPGMEAEKVRRWVACLK